MRQLKITKSITNRDTASLDKYLQEIAKVDLISAEEEVKLAKVLDVYEHRLGESKYLASDHFTLVDLHTIPVIQYLLGTPTKKLFDERPHVSAWVADITSRPSAQKVL